MQRHPSAFSLVELSIVLVILGLLVGGILSGQSLIRASEMRSVLTDMMRYQAAIYSFRDKYFAIPGDMTNATSFWGDDNTNCPDAAIANGTPGTCNGNGNGVISGGAGAEELRAWQQLALAGLIEGSYTGVTNTTPVFLAGTNVPKMKLANGGYRFATTNMYSVTGNAFDLANLSSNISYWQGIFKAEELWNMDSKIDDGLADKGIFVSLNGYDTAGAAYYTDCLTTASQWVGPAGYNLTSTNNHCAGILWIK